MKAPIFYIHIFKSTDYMGVLIKRSHDRTRLYFHASPHTLARLARLARYADDVTINEVGADVSVMMWSPFTLPAPKPVTELPQIILDQSAPFVELLRLSDRKAV